MPVTSPAGYLDPPIGQAGFTLVEILCVLAIVALLAAIALPAMPRGTSMSRLEAYAMQTAALLNADHLAARRRRTQVATSIDAPLRTIRSGASSRVLRLPSDVSVEALLADRCDGRAAGSTILHFGSGMSCGGVVTLLRAGVGYQVRVNWLTGGAEVVPVR